MMFKGLLKEISRISTESFHLTEFGDTILKSYPEALEKMHVPPSMCFPLINFVLVYFFFRRFRLDSAVFDMAFLFHRFRASHLPEPDTFALKEATQRIQKAASAVDHCTQ